MKTQIIKINPATPEMHLIDEAARVIRDGGLVAFPTETVYGIAANFLNAQTIERLCYIKRRPRDKPFTFHIAEFYELNNLKVKIPGEAWRIINRFWPGPLTLICLTMDTKKIGIRMPSNKIATELIRQTSVPVVAPSANISGEKPAISAEEVLSGMDGLIDMIIDGGPADIGRESSILDISRMPFEVLREGAISRYELLCTYHILFVCTGNTCRSVMAKGFLERLIREADLADKVYIDSAGTSAITGADAALNTILSMKEEGVDVSFHKAKSVNADLLRRPDMIFVMEKFHKDILQGMLPERGEKIRLLRPSEDIPDPIGKDIVEYRRVRDIIKEEVGNIFLEIFKKERL